MKKLLVALVVALVFITGAMAVMTQIRDISDEEALVAERIEARSPESLHQRQARIEEVRRLIRQGQ